MMSGFKYELHAYLGEERIATLGLTSEDNLNFCYTKDWQKNGYALSPHLPLDNSAAENQFSIKVFFQNLFPEGENLEILLQNFHLSRFNVFAITRTLGLDLPGALRLLPENGSVETTGFRLIEPAELIERLKHYSPRNLLVWDGRPRLSLAGVHQKINIFINPYGEMGFGEGELCSTHILKFERQSEQHLVLNEFTIMTLAKNMGMNVANVSLRYFDKFPVLLVTRFDRANLQDKVHRRHMIDGCQALNLMPEYKYERHLGSGRDVRHIRDGASLPALFDFCNACQNPALAKKQLVEWVLFNIIIGNWDAHAKNLSFFVSKAGIEITPFYDLLSILVYPEFEQEFSMALGDEFDATSIHAWQLADFADSCDISRAVLAKILSNLCKKILAHLPQLIENASTSKEHVFLSGLINGIHKQAEYLEKQSKLITEIVL